jgi:hypothetical protein
MTRFSFLLFNLVLAVAPVAAQTTAAPGSILSYLPKDTIFAVEVPDIAGTIADFQKMPLAKIWREEEVQQFVQDLVNMAKGQFDRYLAQARKMHEQGAFPVDPDKLLKLRVASATFACTKLDVVGGKPRAAKGDTDVEKKGQTETGGQPQPEIGLILHLDFGDTAKDWFSLVQMGLGLLEQEAGAKMTKSEAKVGAASLITLSPNRANASPMSLNVAMIGNAIVIGTLESEMRSVLENMQKGTPVLGAADALKQSTGKLDLPGSEMRVYVRTDPLFDFAVKAFGVAAQMQPGFPIDPEGVARAIDALGLRSLKSMGFASAYQGGVCVSKSYVAAPAPERKGIMAGANRTLDLGFLKWVPKDAVSFSAACIDPLSVYDGLVGALKAYDPKVAEHALGQLAAMEKQVGFTLRDDLFGSMGDTFIYWSMPLGTITSPPEMAFLLKVKDQDRIIKVFKSLTALSNGMVEIEEGEKRGIKVHSLRVNIDPAGGMGINPFDLITPTMSFQGGYLIAGFSAGDVKRVVDRMGRADDAKGDIRSNKEFEPYLAKLPKDLLSLSFSDWKAQFEGIYQMVTSVLSMIPSSENIPIDMSLLPDSNTITKHLFGAVAYSQADAMGYSSTSISPFGPEVMLLLGGAIGAAAGAFALRGR